MKYKEGKKEGKKKIEIVVKKIKKVSRKGEKRKLKIFYVYWFVWGKI